MRGNYIDFISAYCDGWCERCAFTDRCSAYAVRIATQMCGGDFTAGLELAVGAPPPTTDAERRRRDESQESLNVELTPARHAQFDREEEEQDARVAELPITTLSEVTSTLGWRWLEDNAEPMTEIADA